MWIVTNKDTTKSRILIHQRSISTMAVNIIELHIVIRAEVLTPLGMPRHCW